MKRCRLQNALICLLLVCAFSISLAVPAFAADDVKGTISLEANGKSTTLAVLLRDGVWYAEIQSLAKIAVCNSDRDSKGESVLTTKAAVSQNNGKVVFTRENTVLNYQPIILYTCDKDKNVQVDDSYYVPLEEASKALGIHFTATDGKLYSKATRTVKDLREELNYVFSAPNFNASSIMIDPSTHWATIETASRLYAMLPFVGDGSVVGTLLGTDEDDRFVKAFTNILTLDEDMSNICVDLSNLLSDSETERDILSTVLEEMAKMDGELEQYAKTFKGIDKKVDASQLKEAMSITALIEVASRFDESVACGWADIFQKSENKRVKKTAQKVFDSIYKSKDIQVKTEHWGIRFVLDRIQDNFKEYLKRKKNIHLEPEGMNKLIAYIGAEKIDSITNGSGISNAVIYMSIYTTIQNEIREYYYKNRESMDQTDVAEKLLCAGRLYTKCIYEEYKNCSFDSEIKDSVQSADNCFRNTLKLLMSYEAKECVEEIDNSDFFNTLTEDYASLVHIPPTIPYLGDVPIFIGCTVSEATEVLGTNYERDYEEGSAALIFDDSNLVLVLDGEYYNQELTGKEKIYYQVVYGNQKLSANLTTRSTIQEIAAYQLAQGSMIYPLSDNGNFDCYDSYIVDSTGKYILTYQFESIGSNVSPVSVEISKNDRGLKTGWSDYTRLWTCMDHGLPKNVVLLQVDDISKNSITFSIDWGGFWSLEETTVSLVNGVGSFFDGYGVSGSIQISDGTIKLRVDETDTKYVDTGWFTFVVSSF